MSIPVTFLVALLLLAFGSIFSGLNIGLMMIRPAELKRKAAHGDKIAERLYRYRKDGTYLIVCILLGNVAVISSLSIILDQKFGGPLAGIATTLMVTIFAEIVPQTIFVRKGYTFSRHFFWLLNTVFILFWPLARPLTVVLNRILGEELPTIFTREELTHLIDEHARGEGSTIDVDESKIVHGALHYSTVTASEVMTPLESVDSIDADDEIDMPLLSKLKRLGHSRYPVHSTAHDDFIGIMYMKDLLGEDVPVPVKHVYRDKIFDIPYDAPLDTALSRFTQTRSHLFLVRDDSDRAVGIITIEDVIEKILNREIEDEFDQEH